ncbi:hypothetical protein GCM10009654_13920 [Streptomyces hebeiensis]|uniref:Uncharacterized protein n=1 Tax=Streptomyces hebeiensis TaxID=229486 RepID=A0ABN1UPW4_9ACTN
MGLAVSRAPRLALCLVLVEGRTVRGRRVVRRALTPEPLAGVLLIAAFSAVAAVVVGHVYDCRRRR